MMNGSKPYGPSGGRRGPSSKRRRPRLRASCSSGLDGVTLNTDLTIFNSYLQELNGLILNGTLTLANAGDNRPGMFFAGTQTLSGNGQVVFGGVNSHSFLLPIRGTLTI